MRSIHRTPASARTTGLRACALTASALLVAASHASAQKIPEGAIQAVRCPNEGIQPRIVLDEEAGVLHLLYVAGELEAADLYYVRSSDWAETFSEPVRVNAIEGSVDASDSVEGARIALGPSGTLHVVWMGAAEESLRDDRRAVWYARSMPTDGEGGPGIAFEPQRRLAGESHAIDAAPTVAESPEGLFVFWHEPEYDPGMGPALPSSEDEADEVEEPLDEPLGPRTIYMVLSLDGGETFSTPRAVEPDGHEVSERCAMGAGVDENDIVYVLFQGQKRNQRDWCLLSSHRGEVFRCRFVDNWNIPRKIATAATIVPGRNALLACYEAFGKVWFTRIDPEKRRALMPYTARDTPDWRGRPSVADSESKIAILAWVEGERASEPERLVWQAFYLPERRNIGMGRVLDIPPATVPAAFARPDQTFCILY